MTQFWLDNINILINKKYIFEIIPDTSFDLNRKLNSIMRFCIYFSIISFILNGNSTSFFVAFIAMIVTIFIYKNQINKSNKLVESMSLDLKTDNECIKPTLNNPLMNLNLYDINKNGDKGACSLVSNKNIENEVKNILDIGLPKGSGDIYNNNNGQREFYTTPNTKPAADVETFRDWCYQTPKTCKEGNGLQCSANITNDLTRNYNNGEFGNSLSS